MLLLLFIFLCYCSFAQTKFLDSLREVIKTSTKVERKIDALNELAFEYRKGNTDSGLVIAQQTLALLKTTRYHKGYGSYYETIAGLILNDNLDSALSLLKMAVQEFRYAKDDKSTVSTLTNIANVYIAKTEYDSALQFLWRAKEVMTTTKLLANEKFQTTMWIYQALGNTYYSISQYDSSNFYSYKGMELADKLNNKNAKANFLITLSNVARQMKQYTPAKDFLHAAIPLATSTNDPKTLILIHNNLGDIYMYLKDYAQADQHLNEALLKSKEIDDYWHLGHIYRTKGDIQFNHQRIDLAIPYYKDGIKACEEYGNDFALCGLYQQLGFAYLTKHAYSDAEIAFKQSLSVNDEDKENKQLSYDGLAELYAKQHQFRKAFEYKSLSATLKDSIFNEQSEQTLHLLNVRYETKQRQERIDSLRNENFIASKLASAKNKQKNIAYLLALFTICLSVIGFYLFLKRKKFEREKALFEERLRFSRDLHDDIGSALSGMTIYSDVAVDKISKGKIEEAKEWIDQIRLQSVIMVSNISDLIWMVNTENSTIEKLVTYIRKQFEPVILSKGIQFDCTQLPTVNELRLNSKQQRQILHVCKEIINNSMKHAEASHISMHFGLKDKVLSLLIKDDGKGFDVNEIKRGNGISNIEIRIEELGGSLNLESILNLGTTYQIEIPY